MSSIETQQTVQNRRDPIGFLMVILINIIKSLKLKKSMTEGKSEQNLVADPGI